MFVRKSHNHRNLEPLDLLIIQHDKYVEIGFGMMNALAKCQMPRVLIKNNWSYKFIWYTYCFLYSTLMVFPFTKLAFTEKSHLVRTEDMNFIS
jgi:hypothetical protein